MTRVHYIGIGGVGMSALAQMDLHRGRTVTGSDAHSGPVLDRLAAMGATVHVGHAAEHVREARPDAVVYTDAVQPDNPELVEAQRLGIPLYRRAEYLGRIMDEFPGHRIGVAGTHGKTTTTAMLGEVLLAGGCDPTVLVGGDYTPFGGNLRLGGQRAFVTEACEAFRSFHLLHPDVAIIVNIEPDHLDCYGSPAGVREGFVRFVEGIRPGGTLVILDKSGDEALVANAASGRGLRVLRFGEGPSPDCDLWAEDVHEAGGSVRFRLRWSGGDGTLDVLVPVPGRHNVLNALAALAAARALGVKPEDAVVGLSRFQGVGRRFEKLGEAHDIIVVDDYAHHPTELRATLSAARVAFPGRRLVAVFQPHLYSRTRDFLDEFSEVLAEADLLILTDIYRAREEPIAGVDIADLARKIVERPGGPPVHVERDKGLVPSRVLSLVQPGDVVLILGAGDIREAGERLVEHLAKWGKAS